jgi:hypothetical protein
VLTTAYANLPEHKAITFMSIDAERDLEVPIKLPTGKYSLYNERKTLATNAHQLIPDL